MKSLFSKGIVLSALVLSISSCNKNYTAAPGTTAPGSSGNDIQLATNATLGNYLRNNQGLSLYMFANDADGTGSCTDCENTWPAFTADLTNIKLDAGLSAANFATITIAGGKKQVTYKGWPLYTFSPSRSDGYGNTANVAEPAGATRGDGLNGLRFIAKPDYTIMLADKQLTGLDGKNYKSDYTVGTGNTVYFTDGTGRTLYTFISDSFNINKFTNADFSNNAAFPIYEQHQIVVPSILDKTLFGSIIFNGRNQMTYKGRPLYFFGQDTNRGSNKAVSVPQVGVWPVAIKDVVEATK